MDLSFLPDPTPLAPYLSALAVALPVAWLAIRGRSLFPLRLRLWRLIHRKADVEAEWLAGPIRERMELMKCRALVMWADSYAEARRVEAWATARGVDLGTLGECRNYFDRKALTISDKLPHLWRVRGTALVFAYIACLFMTFGAILLSKDEAMVSLKANGHRFYLSAEGAHPLGVPRYAAMTVTDCKTNDDPAGFNGDRADVCDILSDPHLPAAVVSDVKAQHLAGGALCVLAAFVLLLLYRWTASVRSSHAVRDQIERHAAASIPVPSGGPVGRESW
ncbi:DUF6216 family protein [Luteibacter aegosomaticola]|uniref:DUF6216 family protein n=1 Tax=Luteibacter aegosomaticola TaxID=2911538 RepID=UPI001FF86298|nr:DUF6216 family protein [Luteibacter aegosomaticola]UPG88334.1 DUF6216 family protein [Luteibacter aegosomaticola]